MTCDFYKNDSGEFYITRKQIGRALEYSDPQKAIDNIHSRNFDRLDVLSVTLKLRGTDGKMYDTRVYTLRGAMEICRFSRQPFVSLYQAESVRWQLSLAACLRPAVLF